MRAWDAEEMPVHTPHYLNAQKSGNRGLVEGWYALDGDGKLSFGPFSTRESCLSRISQFTAWAASSALRLRPS
jgi:hypothetical protein